MANDLSSIDLQNAVEEFGKWFFHNRCPEALNLLITGKISTGKSRLVNALVGRNVAKEGRRKDPCTSEVRSYQLDIEGVPVNVWDSPGLQGGIPNEAMYIQDMKRKIKDVALMIYCVRMDEERFYEADKKAIRILTDEFGKEVWNHAVVALTFANKVENPDGEEDLEYFQSQLKEWENQLKYYFASVGLNPETCSSIPVIPVGNKARSMRLPDRENWLSDLWVECFEAMKESGRRGMYKINRLRLTAQSSSSIDRDMPCESSSTDTEQTVIAKFKNWFFDESWQPTLNLLITGKISVGKSRLVNALVGRNVAKEGSRKDPCTSEVRSYQLDIEGVQVTVWDSPGLQGGTPNEDTYIQDMKRKIKCVALMIYCVRMDETRFYDADKKAIRTLTDEFGKEVWNRAVVALTFANRVEDPDEEDELKYFQSQLKEWENQLKYYFASVGLNPKTCKSIPVIPVGNKKTSMCLPDRENWLSELRIECCRILKL